MNNLLYLDGKRVITLVFRGNLAKGVVKRFHFSPRSIYNREERWNWYWVRSSATAYSYFLKICYFTSPFMKYLRRYIVLLKCKISYFIIFSFQSISTHFWRITNLIHRHYYQSWWRSLDPRFIESRWKTNVRSKFNGFCMHYILNGFCFAFVFYIK